MKRKWFIKMPINFCWFETSAKCVITLTNQRSNGEKKKRREEERKDIQWDSHHVSHFTFSPNSLNIVCRCSLSWNRMCLCIYFVVMMYLSLTLRYRSMLLCRCFSYKSVYLFSPIDKRKKNGTTERVPVVWIMMNFYREFFGIDKERLNKIPTHKLRENVVLCKNEIRPWEKILPILLCCCCCYRWYNIDPMSSKKNERKKIEGEKEEKTGIIEKKTFENELIQHPPFSCPQAQLNSNRTILACLRHYFLERKKERNSIAKLPHAALFSTVYYWATFHRHTLQIMSLLKTRLNHLFVVFRCLHNACAACSEEKKKFDEQL